MINYIEDYAHCRVYKYTFLKWPFIYSCHVLSDYQFVEIVGGSNQMQMKEVTTGDELFMIVEHYI